MKFSSGKSFIFIDYFEYLKHKDRIKNYDFFPVYLTKTQLNGIFEFYTEYI